MDDMAAINSYSRLYNLLNRAPYEGERTELKCNLVRQWTKGRTDSLKEMDMREYTDMCNALAKSFPDIEPDESKRYSQEMLRHSRSICLKLMQQIGVDTTSWTKVNEFCRNPRIAGTEFRDIDVEELAKLSVKLRAIKKKMQGTGSTCLAREA